MKARASSRKNPSEAMEQPLNDPHTEAAEQTAEQPETLITPPLSVNLSNVTICRRKNQRRRFGLYGTPPANFNEEDQAIIQHFDFAHCHEDGIPQLEDKENLPAGGTADDGADSNTCGSKETQFIAHSKVAICSAKKRLVTAAQRIASKERPCRRRKPQLPLQNACVLVSPLDGRSARGRARSLRAARINKRNHQSNAEETPKKAPASLCALQRLFGG